MPVDERLDPGGLEPASDVVGIKAYALSPLQKRNASFRDQTPNVSVGDPQVRGETGDVKQVRRTNVSCSTVRSARTRASRFRSPTPTRSCVPRR